MDAIAAAGIDFGELTRRLDDQLARVEITKIVTEGDITPEDVMCSIVSVTASGYFEGNAPGQEPHLLSIWHSSVRYRCSTLYRQISEENPSLDKADINNTPELRRLNIIRRGLRLATRDSYKLTSKEARRGNHLPQAHNVT